MKSITIVAVVVLAFGGTLLADTFVVTQTGDSGPGSLRQAITDANGRAGVDTIAFSIPGAGVHTITPVTQLPSITDAVVIDGYTQPSASPNTLANGDNAQIRIELSGQSAGAANGLNINAPNSIVRGLSINSFTGAHPNGHALFITGNSNTIQGCFLGTDPTGESARPNDRDGIFFDGGQNNIVGGVTPAQRNIISGNSLTGIVLVNAAQGDQIQGNYIGTDATGMSDLGNNGAGVVINNSSNNVVGGTTNAARNLISGSGTSALRASGVVLEAGATNNVIEGNFIGTDVAGTGNLGNSDFGIIVATSANNNTVGGIVAGAANTIAFSSRDGVRVQDAATINNAILSNAIFNNGELAINLGFDSVTPNDPGDGDTGSNNLQNFPVITSATNDGTNTTIAGAFNSTANGAFRLEFFSNSVRDASGFGQGENFIGVTGVTTDGSGNASFNSSFPQVNDGQWITATATDSIGNTSEFCASVAATGPVILNTTTVTARSGQPFKFRVLTTGGNPAPRLSVTGLPPGLTANAVTGIISGTPTTDGSNNVLVTVTDGAITIQGTLRIAVVSDPGLPVIVSPSVASVPQGQSFSYKIEAPANTTASDTTTFSIAGTLPAGLTFNGSTGIISGTLPTVKSAHEGEGDVKALSGGTLLAIIQMFATNSHGRTTSPLALLQLPPMAVNISTRLPVGTGENVLIAGFIVTGNAPKIVIIRGIGPSLNGSGLQGVLQDPQLELRNGAGALLIANDNWRSDQAAEINETTIPPTNDLESAIVALLDPGSYTAILRGTDNSTGIAVVEGYDLGTASMDVGSGAQLANISTRGFVNTSDNVMIGGIISANGSAKFIIRALGPSLSGSGIQGALQDPTLELRSSNGTLLSSNDNWKTRPDGSSQQAAIEATTIPPTNDLESALVQTVAPGNYTAIVRGKNNATGVGLVEVYNLQ